MASTLTRSPSSCPRGVTGYGRTLCCHSMGVGVLWGITGCGHMCYLCCNFWDRECLWHPATHTQALAHLTSSSPRRSFGLCFLDSPVLVLHSLFQVSSSLCPGLRPRCSPFAQGPLHSCHTLSQSVRCHPLLFPICLPAQVSLLRPSPTCSCLPALST